MKMLSPQTATYGLKKYTSHTFFDWYVYQLSYLTHVGTSAPLPHLTSCSRFPISAQWTFVKGLSFGVSSYCVHGQMFSDIDHLYAAGTELYPISLY